MKQFIKKIILGFKIAFADQKKHKWPADLFEIDEAIYPYFLQAYELNPDGDDYEHARDLLDQAIEEIYQRLNGNVPKIELSRSEEDSDEESELISPNNEQ